jgi:hypothetical protein
MTDGSNNTTGGAYSLYSTTGDGNTAFGFFAGEINTTGTLNTFIGYQAGYTGTSVGLTKAAAIGYNAQVTADNTMVLGGSGSDSVHVVINGTSGAANLNVTCSDASTTACILRGAAAQAVNVFEIHDSTNALNASIPDTGAARFGVPATVSFPGISLAGVTDGGAVVPGQVGEPLTSVVAAAGVGATTVTGNITSLTLTPGDWNVSGYIVLHGGATGFTVNTIQKMSVVGTSATDGTSGYDMVQQSTLALLANGVFTMAIPNLHVLVSANKVYYLTANVTYAAGTPTADATLVATRIR